MAGEGMSEGEFLFYLKLKDSKRQARLNQLSSFILLIQMKEERNRF